MSITATSFISTVPEEPSLPRRSSSRYPGIPAGHDFHLLRVCRVLPGRAAGAWPDAQFRCREIVPAFSLLCVLPELEHPLYLFAALHVLDGLLGRPKNGPDHRPHVPQTAAPAQSFGESWIAGVLQIQQFFPGECVRWIEC